MENTKLETDTFSTKEELAARIITVPGDGPRLFICLLEGFGDNSEPNFTIVAIADNIATLAERVSETGLIKTHVKVDHNSTYRYTLVYSTDSGEVGHDLVVLDVPPATMRCLNLANLHASIEQIEKQAALPQSGPKA
jgi:hypothetical protein